MNLPLFFAKKRKVFLLSGLNLIILFFLVRLLVHADTQVAVYTGCLSSNGNLDKVAIGTSPASACSGNQTQISWSIGDITSVTAGVGLSSNGPGQTGDLSLSIANNGVNTLQLADNAVTTPKLSDASITTLKLVDASITTPKLASGSVTTTILSDNAITTAKLGLSSVDTANIIDSSVTGAKLADGSVTPNKISNDASETSRLATWTGDDYSFDATGATYQVRGTINPNVTVTVPTGKAYYYLVNFDGHFRYFINERTNNQSNFYGDWSAQLLDNTSLASIDVPIVQTGYRYDWNNLGAGYYWASPFHASWLVRLGEGTHQISVSILGFSDTTMQLAHFYGLRFQLMRTL